MKNNRFIYYKLNQNFTKTKWIYDVKKIKPVAKEPKPVGTIYKNSFIGKTLMKKVITAFTNGERYTNEELDYTTTKLFKEHRDQVKDKLRKSNFMVRMLKTQLHMSTDKIEMWKEKYYMLEHMKDKSQERESPQYHVNIGE